MRMIFSYANGNYLFSHRVLAFIASLALASAVSADVTVNYLENNDKISSNSLSLQTVANDQAENRPGTATAHPDAASGMLELRAEQWELARSGESILDLPVLNQLINAWLQDKRMKIELRYPGGEEGEFWVQQLTDWLVSLGIPSDQMVAIPGSGAGDSIKFALIK